MIRGGLVGGGQAECTSLMVFAQPDGPSQVGIQKFSIFLGPKDSGNIFTYYLPKRNCQFKQTNCYLFCTQKGEKLHHALSINLKYFIQNFNLFLKNLETKCTLVMMFSWAATPARWEFKSSICHFLLDKL